MISKQDSSNRKPLVANPIILIVLLIFMGVLVFGKGTLFPSSNEASAEPKDMNSHQLVTKLKKL